MRLLHALLALRAAALVLPGMAATDPAEAAKRITREIEVEVAA